MMGHRRVVTGTCPGVREDPAVLTSQPCLPASPVVDRKGGWSARLANFTLLRMFLNPCSSVLEKGAVSSHFQRKAAS